MNDVICPLPEPIDYKRAKATYTQVRKDTNYKLSPENNRREAARRLGTDYETFSRVLASKGKAATAVQAPDMPAFLAQLPRLDKDATWNDRFTGSNPLHTAWDDATNTNCSRTAQAFEMRMQGYDVFGPALRATKNIFQISKGWTRGEKYSKEHLEALLKLGIHPSDLPGEFKPVEWSAHQTSKAMVDTTKGDPVGARYFVYTKWKTGSAHMYNAIMEKGGLRFIDPQQNDPDVSRYLPQGEGFAIVRVDNAQPLEGALEDITWKGKS